MKRSLAVFSVIPLTALMLAACDSSAETPVTESSESSSALSSEPKSDRSSEPSTAANSEPELVPQGSTVTGKIGKAHGYDCVALGDCSITFTVGELSRAETCPDTLGQTTSGNFIHVSGTISSKAEPYNPAFQIGIWPVFVNWSTVGADGIDKPTEIVAECLPDAGWRGTWDQEIRPGDTRSFSQYMEIPEGSEKLRMTDTINGGGRWEFSIPDGK